jgi:hypothetical protein
VQSPGLVGIAHLNKVNSRLRPQGMSSEGGGHSDVSSWQIDLCSGFNVPRKDGPIPLWTGRRRRRR